MDTVLLLELLYLFADRWPCGDEHLFRNVPEHSETPTKQRLALAIPAQIVEDLPHMTRDASCPKCES